MADLVDQMTSQGLTFAPATQNDQTAYSVLYQALLNYDYRLSQLAFAVTSAAARRGPADARNRRGELPRNAIAFCNVSVAPSPTATAPAPCPTSPSAAASATRAAGPIPSSASATNAPPQGDSCMSSPTPKPPRTPS